jgi:uncharacterized membrane protein YfcA
MVFGLVVSVFGGGIHLFAGHYDSGITAKLITGGLAGAVCGATLSSVVPHRPLRMAISVWLATLGLQLCWRAVV